MNQLERILELTGHPSESDIEAMKSPFAATMLEALPLRKKRYILLYTFKLMVPYIYLEWQVI
jgi:hypothetical protein